MDCADSVDEVEATDCHDPVRFSSTVLAFFCVISLASGEASLFTLRSRLLMPLAVLPDPFLAALRCFGIRIISSTRARTHHLAANHGISHRRVNVNVQEKTHFFIILIPCQAWNFLLVDNTARCNGF